MSKSLIKTSEGQVLLVSAIIQILNITGAWDWTSNWHSGILLTISAAVYKVARGLAKAGVLRAPA